MAREKVVVDFGLWGALAAPSLPEIGGAVATRARSGSRRSCRSRSPSTRNVTDAEFLEGMRRAKERRRPRARARRERLAAPGRARADARGRAARPARPPRVAAAVRRGGGRAPGALPRGARRRAHPDRARLEPGQRRSRAPRARREGRRATMEVCPHHLLLDLDDLVRLGPYGALRSGAARPRPRRAAVGRGARRDGGLPRLRPLRVHDRGEGARLGRHLRRAARLPGDAGDGAARARRGLPPARHAARRVRPLLVDERGAHDRASTRARARSCPGADADLAVYDLERSGRSTRGASSSRRTRGRRSTAAGRAPGSCARSCAARRSTRTARSWPRPARAGSSRATTTTRSAAPAGREQG